jgi:transposase
MEWKPSKLTREQMEERRLEAARLFKEQALSHAQIAQALGVSRTAVSKWFSHYRTGGSRRLQQRRAGGRPPKLSRRERHRLKQQLQKGALAAGCPTDRWTLSRIAHLIEQAFAVSYHPNYLNRLLKPLGFSLQVPLPRAAERDEELIRAWLEQDWPRIKKSAAALSRDRLLR